MSDGLKCRSCGEGTLSEVLDLGIQPLANNLLTEADLEKEPKFPLRLMVCEHCWLMQISEIVPPVDLFSDYLYFSSFSDTMLEHSRRAAHQHTEDFSLGSENLVVEIASNDGYLLKNFKELNIPSLGIEPAANIAEVAEKEGIETIVEFFGTPLAQKLAAEGRGADLILGNNVFAHAPETNDFVGGLKALLNPNGVIALEFPYGVHFVERLEFDTVYHEHVYYFTLTALNPLFARHGLVIFRTEQLSIHGGSLRLYACHAGTRGIEDSAADLLNDESSRRVNKRSYYDRFATSVDSIRNDLLAKVTQLKAAGKSIAAYGASAKGSTLLNYYGLGADSLDFVADRSTHKQGKLTPGTHLPIQPPEALLQEQPDYALLLTWNFADEILAQQQAYRDKGGQFIIPLPEVKVV
ncbi:MAG: methyltransferase [Verrucomicrobiales bacterium]|nr:methyltransferase [Verrucomicrobiales bacterium]|tara:strand:- start:11989 stop:13215 length:1227 start_codon:yes stop_codon:yes gene_type:complete